MQKLCFFYPTYPYCGPNDGKQTIQETKSQQTAVEKLWDSVALEILPDDTMHLQFLFTSNVYK